MTRFPISNFESAARELCRLRGKDPELLSYYGDKEGRKRPLWVNVAENLRSHYECDIALEKAGL